MKMNIKNKQVQVLDDEFVEIQSKFVNFKKAEKELYETLGEIDNEEKFASDYSNLLKLMLNEIYEHRLLQENKKQMYRGGPKTAPLASAWGTSLLHNASPHP
jgi:hypothetical protein